MYVIEKDEKFFTADQPFKFSLSTDGTLSVHVVARFGPTYDLPVMENGLIHWYNCKNFSPQDALEWGVWVEAFMRDSRDRMALKRAETEKAIEILRERFPEDPEE